MSRYEVYVTPLAWNEMRSLPGHMRQRVRRAVKALADDPRPASSKLLDVPGFERELRRLQLDNSEYFDANDQGWIRLSKCVFDNGNVHIKIEEQPAFGHLNGDNAIDGVVVLREWHGGTGLGFSFVQRSIDSNLCVSRGSIIHG